MKRKFHTALFFTLLFCCKIFVAEAQTVNFIFELEQITVVKPQCKKNNGKSKEQGKLNQTSESIPSALSLNCQTPMQLNTTTSSYATKLNTKKPYLYKRLNFNSLLLNKPSPPPKDHFLKA